MRGGARESSTSVRRLGAVDRQAQALGMRLGGATYHNIAESLGYRSPSGAHKAVESALKATLQEPADAVRAIELSRLDRMIMAIWPQATKGSYEAIDRVLKIMVRRADYLGIDAPKEIKVAHEMQALADRVAEEMSLNAADIIAEAERIVAAVGSVD